MNLRNILDKIDSLAEAEDSVFGPDGKITGMPPALGTPKTPATPQSPMVPRDPHVIQSKDKIGDIADIQKRQANKQAAQKLITQLNQLSVELQKAMSQHSMYESKIAKKLIESFGYNLDEAPLSQFGTAGRNVAAGRAAFAPQAAELKDLAKSSQTSAAKDALSNANLGLSAASSLGKGALGKAAGKILPGVGAAYGAVDAYNRYQQGDTLGAGIAGLSGALSLIPGVGWVPALALDAINMGRDASKASRADRAQGGAKARSQESIIALQKQLKAKGADLGNFGPNKDGIDGVMGKKTRDAMKQFGMAESVAESLRSLQDRLAMIESAIAETVPEADPMINQLGQAAKEIGGQVLKLQSGAVVVQTPDGKFFDANGKELNPEALEEGAADLHEGIAQLFNVLKSYGSKIAQSPLARNIGKATAAIAGGGAVGYGLDQAFGGPEGSAKAKPTGGAKAGASAAAGVNDNVPPGQNKLVQEIVRQMKGLIGQIYQLNDPAGMGAIRAAQDQISKIQGLPAELIQL